MDEQSKKVAKKAVTKVQAYQSVFSGKEGQEVLEDLIKTHYVLGTTFDGDATKIIFREGERNVVLRILSLLKMDAKVIQERIRLHENNLE